MPAKLRPAIRLDRLRSMPGRRQAMRSTGARLTAPSATWALPQRSQPAPSGNRVGISTRQQTGQPACVRRSARRAERSGSRRIAQGSKNRASGSYTSSDEIGGSTSSVDVVALTFAWGYGESINSTPADAERGRDVYATRGRRRRGMRREGVRSILVTGSSGLIGSEVCTYLAEQGFAAHGSAPADGAVPVSEPPRSSASPTGQPSD